MTRTPNELEFGAVALLAALSAHHPTTAGQQTRVCQIAIRIGRAMRLGASQLQDLKFGALLHDVGKLAVSPEILSKRETLNAADWTTIKHHPTHGANMLEALNYPAAVSLIVAEHHETFSGTGYPFAKTGDQISIGARIVAVADSYDAITKDREYRKGQPHNVALKEILDWSGRQFDPAVVNTLLAIMPPTLAGQPAAA